MVHLPYPNVRLRLCGMKASILSRGQNLAMARRVLAASTLASQGMSGPPPYRVNPPMSPRGSGMRGRICTTPAGRYRHLRNGQLGEDGA
jgi:hypothetical protein